MTEVNNNRSKLINMLAMSEDIAKTNNRIYELLRSLMNNPEELTNIKTSINTLYDKVTTLKNSDIGIPLIEDERILIPGPSDVSPKEDPNYKKHEQVLPNPNLELKLEEPTPEPALEPTPEPTPEPALEPTPEPAHIAEPQKKLRQTRKIRKTTGGANTRRPNKRPNKPLNNRKRTPQPNEDNQQK